LAQSGDTERAMKLLDEALRLHPNHVELRISQARVHELAGRLDYARAVLRVTLAAHPRDPEIRSGFAEFEDRQGNPARAVALVEVILEDDPDNAGALNFIGYSLADRNIDLPRAEALLARAQELLPGNAFVLDSVGWLRFRQGRLKNARAALEQAVKIIPGEPELMWHLGEVLLAQGLNARARALLTRARELAPEPHTKARIDAQLRRLTR
jgi:Flp pilus assembly protein TadD